MEEARSALISFFELLNYREYEKAAALYGGEYQGLREWNPLLDPQDHAALLKNGCEINGLQCLHVKRIVDEKVVSTVIRNCAGEFLVVELPVYVP